MRYISILLLFLSLAACSSSRQTLRDDGKIEFQLLQINDVYEIQPLEGGKLGGLARVATLKKELLAKNPNTFFALAGDFFSPSFYGTIKVNGERLYGKQMVDVLNVAGLDMATFGNHEFDIPEADVQKRLNESKFEWVSANVKYVKGDSTMAFFQERDGTRRYIPQYLRKSIQDADGTRAEVCFIGVTLPYNKRNYTAYDDVFAATETVVRNIVNGCHAIVVITHLPIEDDLKLAERIGPYGRVILLMGGHEHENTFRDVGPVFITKADANAKTAYVHTLTIDFKRRDTKLSSVLRRVDDGLALDPQTDAAVSRWKQVVAETMASSGNAMQLDTYLTTLQTPLEGRESKIRTEQTNLGGLIAKGMLLAGKNQSEAAIFNGGSVRLDDELKGEITVLDVMRTLPYGGGLVELEIEGAELKKILDIGIQNKGTGGYLQWANIQQTAAGWQINGQAMADSQVYRIITSDFLFSGLERNLSFFKEGNAAVKTIWRPNAQDKSDLRNSIQACFIEALQYR